jgi:ketosteroid isomerase-like protein
MRIAYWLLTAAVFLPAGGATRGEDTMTAAIHPEWTEEQHRVWDTVTEWNDAFARNDADAYFRFIDDDIVVITPDNPYRVEGVADDREEFEFAVGKGFSKVGYFQEALPYVRVMGNAAYVTYFSRGYYGEGQNARTSYFKETDILVKLDGQWKIVHIHVSRTD